MLGENLLPYMMGGAMAGFFFASMMFLFLLLAAVYVYSAYAWMLIAKKLKYDKPWLAWIPFANVSMIFQLGGFHWALVFLLLIPFLGWIAVFVLSIIAHWRIFEKRKYPGWYSLSVIVPYVGSILYLVAIGLVAWKDKKK